MVIPHSKHFTAGWRLISDTLETAEKTSLNQNSFQAGLYHAVQ